MLWRGRAMLPSWDRDQREIRKAALFRETLDADASVWRDKQRGLSVEQPDTSCPHIRTIAYFLLGRSRGQRSIWLQDTPFFLRIYFRPGDSLSVKNQEPPPPAPTVPVWTLASASTCSIWTMIIKIWRGWNGCLRMTQPWYKVFRMFPRLHSLILLLFTFSLTNVWQIWEERCSRMESRIKVRRMDSH